MLPPLEDTIRSVQIHRDCLGTYEQWQVDGYRMSCSLVERAVVIVNNALIKKTLHAMETGQCSLRRGVRRLLYQC